jgi:hypothetical protein
MPLKRAYYIIRQKISDTPADIILQAAIKAINNIAGLKGLIPTLLIFRVYLRISTDSIISDIQRRVAAINLVIKKLRQLQAQRKVYKTLNIRNGPNVTTIL